MKMNDYLCKNVTPDKNGDVKLGSILRQSLNSLETLFTCILVIFLVGFTVIVLFADIFGFFCEIKESIFDKPRSVDLSDVLTIFGLGLSMVIPCFIVASVIERISNITIARCPITDDQLQEDGVENDNEDLKDVKNTIISNISFSMLLLLIGIFVVNALSVSSNFESEELRLLAFIVFMLSGVRLISFVRLPNLEYKPRKTIAQKRFECIEKRKKEGMKIEDAIKMCNCRYGNHGSR